MIRDDIARFADGWLIAMGVLCPAFLFVVIVSGPDSGYLFGLSLIAIAVSMACMLSFAWRVWA